MTDFKPDSSDEDVKGALEGAIPVLASHKRISIAVRLGMLVKKRRKSDPSVTAVNLWPLIRHNTDELYVTAEVRAMQ